MIRGQDYSQKLADYIKRNVSKGYTVESLRWALVSQGQSRVQVDKAVKLFNEQMAASAPKIETKPIVEETVEVVEQQPEKRSIWQKLFG